MAPGSCPLCRSQSSRREFTKKGFDYHRCGACRHVFVDPLPSPDQSRAYYALIHNSEYLQESHAWFEELARRRMDLLTTRDLPPGRRLLDVGSGHGFFQAEAGRRGWDALGIETSEQPRCFATEELGVRVVAEDIEGDWWGRTAREFDVITFWHVLEHLERPGHVLKNALSRLAPGGLLVVNSPNLDSAVYRLAGRHWSWIYTPGHLQYFSTSSLAAWFRGAGLELVERQTWTDAPNLYFLLEEAFLIRIKDRLQQSGHRGFRLKGNHLSRYLAGERHKMDRQFRLARWYEKTPGLDAYLVRKNLGHEFLLIARKL